MPLVESLQNECVVKNHDVDALIPPPGGRSHAVPAARSTWRSARCKRRRDRDELAGRAKCSACRAIRCRTTPTGPARPCSPTRARRTTDASPDRAVARHRRASAANAAGTRTRCCGRSAAGWTSSSAASACAADAAPRPARRRRRRRLLAGRGDRAGVVAAPARRDEGAGARVARDARVARRRRLTLRPAGGVLPAGPRRAAVLARRAAVPRVHLRGHGEPHHGGGRSRGCRGGADATGRPRRAGGSPSRRRRDRSGVDDAPVDEPHFAVDHAGGHGDVRDQHDRLVVADAPTAGR